MRRTVGILLFLKTGFFRNFSLEKIPIFPQNLSFDENASICFDFL